MRPSMETLVQVFSEDAKQKRMKEAREREVDRAVRAAYYWAYTAPMTAMRDHVAREKPFPIIYTVVARKWREQHAR